MKYDLKYSQYGASSILIEWPSLIDENILKDIINFKKVITVNYIELKVEVISAYNSLLINYVLTIDKFNSRVFELKSLYESTAIKLNFKQTLWEIPVCYNDEFAIDLDNFSLKKQLPKSEIIQRHSSQIYTIYFIGFLPGFLYLGGLDKSLHFNRKSTPNLNIKKGAVGIGGNQTGIYPQNSPGGWHIIGNSPVDFFDLKSKNPCFANAGDKLKFKPISKSEFDAISSAVKTNSYKLKKTLIDDQST